jgi:hypothetical protein
MPTADRDPRRTIGDELLSVAPVTVFHDPAPLQRTLAALQEAGYHVVRADAGAWHTAPEMHAELARSLEFPSYYGDNLDAFNDSLGDVAERAYGLPHDATGLVLALTGYDRFASAVPGVADALLDIVAARSRDALATGEQLICLIQADDPHFTWPPSA